MDGEALAREKDQRREAIRLSGGRVFLDTLEPVLLQSSLIVSLYGGGLAASCSVEEHHRIVDALERGDAAKAIELMAQRLTHIEDSLRLDIEEDEEPDFAAHFK